MKKSEFIFSILQVVIDLLMIIFAGMVAFELRNTAEVQALIQKPGIFQYSRTEFLRVMLFIAPVAIFFYAIEGLYVIRSTRKFLREAFAIFKATSIVLVLVILGFFLQREWFSSRFTIFTGWILIMSAVLTGRFVMQSIQKWLLTQKGVGMRRVLLLGIGDHMARLHSTLHKKRHLGYRVVDHVDYVNLKQIKEITADKKIDELFVSEASIPDDTVEKLHDFAQINSIGYKSLPTALQTTRFDMTIFEGEPLIEMVHTPLDGWGKIAKRIFDIIFSSALIILFSPLMIVTAIMMKLADRGPIIYKSERIAGSGKKFYAYKFRYMKWKYCIHPDNRDLEDAKKYEQQLIKERNARTGALYKIRNDPRKTVFGSFIEKYSIDELPQFFNVLCGDMSLVGPRPHQEREVKEYREYHRRLLTIIPGVTGMAQISGRSDLDFEDEYKLDVYYIENWSLWLDFVILLKTPAALLKRRNNNGR